MQELAWRAVSLAMATSPFEWMMLHSYASTATAKTKSKHFFSVQPLPTCTCVWNKKRIDIWNPTWSSNWACNFCIWFSGVLKVVEWSARFYGSRILGGKRNESARIYPLSWCQIPMPLHFILCSWLLLMGIRENNLFWSKDSKLMFLFVLWQRMSTRQTTERSLFTLSQEKMVL